MNKKKKSERFQKLIQDYKGIIYKVLQIYCKNAEDRKDVEQEILLQLWKSLDNYNDSYKVSTWMYKIAMNVAISSYRKNSKTPKPLPASSIFSEKIEELNEEESPYKHILNHFIKELNEFDKALMLLYLEDYSYKEIGELIGITETNVGSKLNRIKNKFKKKYQNGITGF
ncbi:RNA polymerase sigma factor [Aquimarina brevivitae]|uniref:RNA polymerase sigma-70 factor (ECF subfamily) n=1 Tax=Aquimarina brevivitae TaxID=323412 RepID=A0A4Q7PK01_9FLAO|nr:sigma-70 family RNA polymerase sigma factor [Aquimarina brevivitae]RZT00161.1 RNA polymerase sigma-70 factor (ECF subfamily) [Aquimarina brevivitae]